MVSEIKGVIKICPKCLDFKVVKVDSWREGIKEAEEECGCGGKLRPVSMNKNLLKFLSEYNFINILRELGVDFYNDFQMRELCKEKIYARF